MTPAQKVLDRFVGDKPAVKFETVRELLALVESQREALDEAKAHFNSIRSGLTTDINQVEALTKSLAQNAHVEVRLALTHTDEVLKRLGGE